MRPSPEVWIHSPKKNSVKFWHESEVYKSDLCEILYIAGRQWLLLDRITEGRNEMCRKCGAVERALCDGSKD